MSHRSPALLVLMALSSVAMPARAQEAFGWTTDCGFEPGPAAHLAIFERVDPPAAGSEEPLGMIDCIETVHELFALERRPPSVPTITLLDYATACEARVREDVVVRIESRREDGDGGERTGTFLAHVYEPAACGESGALAMIGGPVTVTRPRAGAGASAELVAAVPEAPEHCGDRAVYSFAIPEAGVQLAYVCNQSDVYVVRDGAILAGPDDELTDAIAVVRVGDRTLLAAMDLDSREWLGEIGDDGLHLVAAIGTDVALLEAHRAAYRARTVVWAREDAERDRDETWTGLAQVLCGLATTLLVTLALAFAARARWARKGGAGASRVPVVSVLAMWLLITYGLPRALAGLAVAAVGVLLAVSPGGGWLPSPDPSHSLLIAAWGALSAFAGTLAIACSALSLFASRERARRAIGIAMAVSVFFHVATVVLGLREGVDGVDGLVAFAALCLVELGALAVLAWKR